jgi:hypothetical protein
MITEPTIDRALKVLNHLQQNLEQVRRENRHLRGKVADKHPYHRNTTGRILRRALDDAMAFLVLHADGFTVSRRYVYDLGISERRYSWALGLLRAARIVAARGSAWRELDFLTAETRLHVEYERLKAQPNALELLRLYMPKSMRNTYQGKPW